MTTKPRGRFITLEGGDGAGKTVQARRLEGRLAELGHQTLRTREPGGSAGAEALRNVILSGAAAAFSPMTQTLLFAAARVDHLDKTILPALESGRWVVCDRFADSTRAYQGGRAGMSEFILSIERLTVGANGPDLTLILDISPEAGLARAAARRPAGAPADPFESEGVGFHEALRRRFLAIAAAEPGRCVVIDASGTEDEVADAIWSAVVARLDPSAGRRPGP